ncbi:MAG: cob(I)yrinic acid a,c-diamide adenosyltransferase [Halobacteriales archaeon]|nr:cob(I)yrinic acid a,c-diamide adenosyltransferase [Halobacteriales archaeon]
MTIYTGRGDDGQTDLGNAERTSKAAGRIEAYGTVDECNAHVGAARPSGYDDVDGWLAEIQNELHIVQATLANPDGKAPTVTDGHVADLESRIDAADGELEPLQSFILPGGSDVGAELHVARAVCRRAERRTVALAETEELDGPVLVYLNRLSDALFVLARLVNAREGVPEEPPSY